MGVPVGRGDLWSRYGREGLSPVAGAVDGVSYRAGRCVGWPRTGSDCLSGRRSLDLAPLPSAGRTTIVTREKTEEALG